MPHLLTNPDETQDGNNSREDFLTRIYHTFRARPLFYIAIIHIIITAAISYKNLNPPSQSDAHDIKKNLLSSCEGKIISWPFITSKNRIKFIIQTNDKKRILAITDEESFEKNKNSLIPGAAIKLAKGRYITPRPPANPGEFDYRRYLATKNISAIFYHYSDGYGSLILEEPPRLNWIYHRIRSHIILSLRKYISDENFSSSILIQMLTGDVDESAKENIQPYFSATGVAHVLVISGLHVGYIVGIFWMLFRATAIGAANSALCALPFIWGYAAIAGNTAPVIRATIMATVMIISLFSKRGYDSYQALGIGSIITIFLNPREIFSTGFQLSYAATFGIIHVLKNMAIPTKLSRLPGGIGYILNILWMSAAAQVFTSPIIANYFGFISAVSFPANLIVVPIAGITLALGIFISIISLVSAEIATWAGLLTSCLLKFMFLCVKYLSSLPGAKTFIPPPGIFFTTIYYATAVSIPLFIKNKMRNAALLTLTLFFVATAVTQLINNARKPLFECTFLDLKNGARFSLLEIKNGPKILVNSGAPYDGENPAKRIYIPFLRKKGIKEIDFALITSPELTSYGGLEEILNEIPVKKIYTTPEISLWPEYISLMEKLEAEKIPVVELWPGDELIISKNLTLKALKNPDDIRCKKLHILAIIKTSVGLSISASVRLRFSDTASHYAIIEKINRSPEAPHPLNNKNSGKAMPLTISRNGVARIIRIYNDSQITLK